MHDLSGNDGFGYNPVTIGVKRVNDVIDTEPPAHLDKHNRDYNPPKKDIVESDDLLPYLLPQFMPCVSQDSRR
jgi:hypothetical protein